MNRRHQLLKLSWSAIVCLLLVLLYVAPLYSAQSDAPTCVAPTVFKLAEEDLRQKRFDQAERELDRLRSCPDLSPIAIFNRGWLYGQAHNFEKALSEFNKVGQNVPDRRTHQYAIALAQFELADYRAAIGTLENKGESPDLSPESANLLAVSYSKLGLYVESYKVLTSELDRRPNDRLAYLNLVTLLCDEGKLASAVDVADKAAKAFSQDAEILAVRGAAYTLVGETSKARIDFQAAIRTAPLYGPPRFFLAVSEYKEGKYAAACDEILKALNAGVKDSDLYYLLAESLLRRDPNNINKAITELNRAIQMNPRQVQALSLRGKLRLQQHQLEGAVGDLELAHKIDPSSSSATYNLARAYFVMGKTEQANALSQQLAPSGTDAVNELSDRKLKSALGLQSRGQDR